ncbi:MAG: hypothetical protein ACP5OV_02650 [Acidimicrobiales bacterium]
MRLRIPFVLLGLLTLLSAGAFALSMAEVQPNHQVTITSCGQSGQFAPREIVVACADGNLGYSHLAWMDWGEPTAYAHGVAYQNSCTPTCAAGTIITHSVMIALSGLRANQYHVLTVMNSAGAVVGSAVSLS